MKQRRKLPLDAVITSAHILVAVVLGLTSAALHGIRPEDALTWVLYFGFQGASLAWFLYGPRKLPIRVLSQAAYYSLAYIVIDAFIPVLHRTDGAESLQAADRFLFGCEPAKELHRIFPPVIHEVFAVGYSLFLPYLYFNVARVLLCDGPRNMRRFVSGYAAVYGVGYLGYLLLPSSGPRFYDDLVAGGAFTGITEGPPLSTWLSTFMDDYSGHQCVFPSLHAAASLFLWVFELRFRSPRLAWALSPVVLGIWVGTVYQGYHYGVDLVAALGLVLLGFVAVRYSGAGSRTRTRYRRAAGVSGRDTGPE